MLRKSIIFINLMISILILSACGGGGGGGSSGTPTSKSITGVALDANGVPFPVNTEVLAVDANGNAARGRVVDDTGNFEVVLTSIAGSGKKHKDLGGNIILRVGATSNTASLTIVIPSADGKSSIKVNVNLIVSEASKQFLENLDLTNLFTQVETALNTSIDGKFAQLSSEEQEELASKQSVLTEQDIQSSVSTILTAIFGTNGPSIDFISGNVTTDFQQQLNEAITAVKIKTYQITTSAGANGTISDNVIVDFNGSTTVLITPSTGFEVDQLLLDNVQQTPTEALQLNNVIADHTISVTFKVKSYTITTTSDTNGTISASSIVSHGSNVTVTMTPNSNYEIDELKVDGQVVASAATYSFENVSANHTVSVTYKLISYLISTDAGAHGTITQSFSASHGSDATITITPDTNFAIDVLKVDNEVVTNTNTVLFTNVTSTHSVSVTFKATAYVVSTEAGPNGSITPTTLALPGSNLTIDITPDSGFMIDELKVNGTVVTSASSYTLSNIQKDYQISVTFKVGFTITTSAGSNGSISSSSVVASGSNATITITPNSGYMIDVLTVDSAAVTSTTSYTFTNVLANHTISVTFKPSKIITATAGTNGSISPVGATEVAVGSNQTFTITPNTGYTIDTILVDSVAVANATSYTFTNVTANHSIDVTFKLLTYTITTSAGSNGSITATSIVNYDSTITINITPNATFVVSSLVVDGSSVTPNTSYTFSNVKANHTVSATFALGYNIIATSGANGQISPKGKIGVVSGANQFFNFIPNTGYEVDQLSVDLDPTTAPPNYNFTNVTSDHTIDISFKIKQYFIATTTDSNGTITASATADHFSNVVINMTPNAGYVIDQLTVDSVVVPTVYTYTFSNLSAPHTIAVTYVPGYQILASAGSNGSISPAGTVDVLSGANKQFTITPDTGYELDTLTVDSSGTSPDSFTDPDYFYTFASVSQAHTINATFKLKEFTVYSNEYDSEAGTIIGAWSTIYYGSDAQIKVLPYPGYLIDYLEIDDETIDTTKPESITKNFTNVTEDHYVYVVFKKDTRFEKSNVLTVGTPETPTSFVTRTDFKGIAAGYDHSVALKKDGTVIAWGYDNYGETATYELSNIKSISAGYQRTVALSEDGEVFEIGYTYDSVPETVSSSTVSSISAGTYHTLALVNGEVFAWGYDGDGETVVPTAANSNVQAIAAGYYYSMALKNDGSIVVWGNDEDGLVTNKPTQTGFIAIAAGKYHALALKANGTVVAWGYDSGNDELETSTWSNIVGIAAGEEFSIGLKNDGTVVALGNAENLCAQVPTGLSGVVAISANCEHVMALKSNGSIVSWGYASSIASLSSEVAASNPYDKTNVPTLKIKAISSGESHTVVLLDDGTVRASGDNTFGQTDVPTGLSNIISISAGEYHTLALDANGVVYAWGDNTYQKSTIPVSVSTKLIKAISAGGNHNLCLTSEGKVVAWGNNANSQVDVPTNLSGVKSIAAGYNHSLALKFNGTVVAWGQNNFNQSTVPQAMYYVKEIAAGKNHCVALHGDGTITMWGNNTYGQTTLPSSLNIVAESLSTYEIANTSINNNRVIAIAAGGNHTVALTVGGKVVAWGQNTNDESTIPEMYPNPSSISAGYNNTHMLFSGDVKDIAVYWNYYIAALKANGDVVSYDNYYYILLENAWKIYGGYYDLMEVNALGGVYSYDSYVDSQAYNDVLSLGIGNEHVAALTDYGYIISWGNDDSGETTTQTGYIAVSAGYQFTAGIYYNGTIYAWGNDAYGRATPPNDKYHAKAISSNDNHTLALKADGTVMAWGLDSFGQCTVPANLTNVIAIAAGKNHSLALKADGTVVAWGNNINGQTDVPLGLSGVVAIAAGETFSVALKSDGSIVVWGNYNIN